MSLRLAALAVVVFGAAAWAQAPQAPTFSARVQGVRIDALVTVGERPLAGLTADDFEVRDNGVPQAITVTPRADLPISVILTLDASRSVEGARLEALQGAVRTMLGTLTQGDEAGLITFSRTVGLRVPVTGRVAGIEAALAEVAAGGETALVDASLAALLLGESDPGRSLIVVFSDGDDTASFSTPASVVDVARAGNVLTYGVWSGRAARPRFLRDLADVSGGRLLDVSRPADLGAAFVTIVREFRQRYLITFAPTGVAPGGWHEVDVRVKRRGASVQSRRGYFGAGPPQ